MAAISSLGVGSGLDLEGIVTKLMTAESQPLTRFDQQEAAYQAKISAYGSVKGALSGFQSALSSLNTSSTFRNYSASLADPAVAAVTSTSVAVPGKYSLEVTQLAQAHKIASAGLANTTDAVGTGTLTFSFGTFSGGIFSGNANAAAHTVTIGAGQNTLSGVRDAVNAANVGVTATIVNDGSTNGNRLVFTSNSTGADYSLKVSVADTDSNNVDTSGLSQLAYDPEAAIGSGNNLTEKVQAKNALLTVDGIALSKSTNSVSDAIQGVTLDLQKTNTNTPTLLTISQNSTAVTNAVQGFVKAYNDLNSTLAKLTKYDPTAKTGSVLTGDSTVRGIQSQLRSLIGGAVSGDAADFTNLSQIGVQFSTDGSLTLNTSKLTSALTANLSGVAGLFAALGQSSDSLVNVTTTDKTQPGSYALTVTQLATHGALVGSTPAALSIATGVNDTLDLTVDGVAASITLASGTYANAAALATELQTRINGAASLSANGSAVKVTESGGVFTVTSNRYGSASNILISGSGTAGLFGSAPTTTTGLDVAGTVGDTVGVGSGQSLSGPAGSVTDGLKAEVLGGSTGARGTLSYSRGFAYKLNQALTKLLDSKGPVATRTDGVNKSITAIDVRRTEFKAHLVNVELAYRKQFAALDTMMSSLQKTSSYLSTQLADLPGVNFSKTQNS